MHSWREILRNKDVSSSLLNNFVHELDEVGCLISLLVHLRKVLDCVVYEIFLSLALFSPEINVVKIVLDVLFALLINIGPVDETKSLDHDRETAIEALVSDLDKLPGECVQDFDGSLAVLSIAQGDEDVLLEFGEDSDPFRGFTFQMVVLTVGGIDSAGCFKHLKMRPL
jgi:hypothetical protein